MTSNHRLAPAITLVLAVAFFTGTQSLFTIIILILHVIQVNLRNSIPGIIKFYVSWSLNLFTQIQFYRKKMTEATFVAFLQVQAMLSVAFIHRSPISTRYVHNSRKTWLYTYVDSEEHLGLPLAVS